MTSIELAPTKQPRLALTPDEAAECTGFRRTRIFSAIKNGELSARRHGKSLVIEVGELQRWLRSLPTRGRRPSTTDDAAQSVEAVPA